MFTLLKEDGQARTGILQTKSGEAETPFFMPVATKAVGRFVSAEDYIAVHAKAIIANAFFLSINPCVETFEKMGGIHKFMQYPNIIFTDCGGFLMLPEKLLDISKKIDSDVIMALDCVLPYGKTREEYMEALKKSHKWTQKCK